MTYSAVLHNYPDSRIEDFCHWVSARTSDYAVIPASKADQVIRFKILSKRRRTGIVVRKSSGRYVFVGAAEFHFARFASECGAV